MFAQFNLLYVNIKDEITGAGGQFTLYEFIKDYLRQSNSEGMSLPRRRAN